MAIGEFNDARDYNEVQVAAARSVLLELMLILGEYRQHIVLVGGWTPVFLIPSPTEPHVGSTDVDLAINHAQVTEAGYQTIRQHLIESGYRVAENNPAAFLKKVGNVTVQIDLMSGEYGGTRRDKRHQRVPDTLLRKARGCDLAFIEPEEMLLEGELPDGGKDSVHIRVASIEAFLCMKGFALYGRDKRKDAYDIYYCIREFPGGRDAIVERVRPHIGNGLVREALENIARCFASPEHRGPKRIAEFDGDLDKEAREEIQRDAYERVNYVLTQLGIQTVDVDTYDTKAG